MLFKVCELITNLCLIILVIFIGLHLLNNIFNWHLKFEFRTIQLFVGEIFFYVPIYFLEKDK